MRIGSRDTHNMRRLKYLTVSDVEDICGLTEARKTASASHIPDWQIRPDTEKGQQLDDLLTRGLSPDHIALIRRIQKLSRDAQIELAALAWFGRGDATFDLVIAHARHAYSPTLPYYLADKIELGLYLRHGLQLL